MISNINFSMYVYAYRNVVMQSSSSCYGSNPIHCCYYYITRYYHHFAYYCVMICFPCVCTVCNNIINIAIIINTITLVATASCFFSSSWLQISHSHCFLEFSAFLLSLLFEAAYNLSIISHTFTFTS